MANDFTKRILSESTNGRPIKITRIAGPGDLIHIAVSGTTDFDEIYLWASNSTDYDVIATLEWGGLFDPGDRLKSEVHKNCICLISPGLILHNELEVRCFASVANVVTITGFVNRITVT